MASVASHYLHPDYVQPLPNTASLQADSTKSPLALLAQTCSRVGNDHVPSSSSGSAVRPSSTKLGRSTPEIEAAVRRLSPKQQQRHHMLQNSNSARLMSASPPSSPPTDRLHRVPYQMGGIHDQAFLLRTRQALMMSPNATLTSPASAPSPSTPNDLQTYNDAYNRMKMVLAAASGGMVLPQAPCTQSQSAEICRDPYCKDPYCGSRSVPRMQSPTSKSPRSVSRSPALTPGSRGSAYAPGTSPVGPAPTSAVSYTCSWIASGQYCGRKFPDGEALTVHLRSHTETAHETHTHAPTHATTHATTQPTTQHSPPSLPLLPSLVPSSLPTALSGLQVPLPSTIPGLPSTLAAGIPGLPTGLAGLTTPLPSTLPGLASSLPTGIPGLPSPLVSGIPGLPGSSMVHHALAASMTGSPSPQTHHAPPPSLANPYAALGSQYAAYRAHLAASVYNSPTTGMPSSGLPPSSTSPSVASRYHPYAGKMNHSLPSPAVVPSFYPSYGILPGGRHAAMP